VVWLEHCYSRSSEKDSNPEQTERKLLRSPFSFQNCTLIAKYKALEKNVISNHKLLSLQQSLVRSFTWKIAICWGFKLTVVGDSRRVFPTWPLCSSISQNRK
jgi:hypothetical protein